MPLITSSKTKPAYDVIVVGSGAAGGQSAYVLALGGARVLMLEAGRNYDPVSETPMLNSSFEAPLRGASTPDKPFGFYDATVNGGWKVPDEPYLVRRSRRGPGWYEAADHNVARPTRISCGGGRACSGGRTNHWGRIALAHGALRFQAARARRAGN